MKILFAIGVFLFILINIMAFFHAYRFTHFSKSATATSVLPNGFWSKIKLIVFGVANPKPVAQQMPSNPYQSLIIAGKTPTHAWFFKTENAKGTVLIAHGYASQKSNMLDRSEAFLSMGYNTLLIDFMGCGQSKSYQSTLGFHEAQQVANAFAYLHNIGEKNIILYGKSMGAVAITKAMKDKQLPAQGLILESAFGQMYATVCARFKSMGLPSFPMAGLLTFWGSVQNTFWAFGHNPIQYAKQINCPSLIMVGLEDDKVSFDETQQIYQNLLNPYKKLIAFAHAGHENLLQHSPAIWQSAVAGFLAELPVLND